MGTFLETIKDAKAKRDAARQYVTAADRHRAKARETRAKGRLITAEAHDEIADDLMRQASYEVTGE